MLRGPGSPPVWGWPRTRHVRICSIHSWKAMFDRKRVAKTQRTSGLKMTQEPVERIVFVYTTYPAVVEAQQAGTALLEAQLAACVNILPGMISLYRWKGAIERGDGVVMI